MIRTATPADVPAMLGIYAPYVENTAVSFEYDVPTGAEFAERLENIGVEYPWLVYEQDGAIMGYAYAHRVFSRAAYDWDAEVTIYLSDAARHTGIAHALYTKLESVMRALGYRRLYALITATNTDSCRFHERRGYKLEGTLKRTGLKHGAWHDVNWYTLELTEDRSIPGSRPARYDARMLDRS